MNQHDYMLKLAAVSALVALDPELGSHAGQALVELSAEVEAYEREHFPIPAAINPDDEDVQ